jgi:hypothetical protein
MKEYTFDEIIDYAATHTSALSGEELIARCKKLLIRYDDIRMRKHIAKIIHTLLCDLGFYKENPHTIWTENEIFAYMNKYDI